MSTWREGDEPARNASERRRPPKLRAQRRCAWLAAGVNTPQLSHRDQVRSARRMVPRLLRRWYYLLTGAIP